MRLPALMFDVSNVIHRYHVGNVAEISYWIRRLMPDRVRLARSLPTVWGGLLPAGQHIFAISLVMNHPAALAVATSASGCMVFFLTAEFAAASHAPAATHRFTRQGSCSCCRRSTANQTVEMVLTTVQ